MALSLATVAALHGSVTAQHPPVRPVPTSYGTTVSPWPSKPKQPAVNTAAPPVTYPSARDTEGGASPFSPPVPVQVGAAGQPHRTLYYRKDSHAPLKPAPAAEVAMPVAAQDANMGGQLPRDAGEQPRNPNETLPPPQARSADPSKEPLIPPAEQLFRLDSEPRYVERENERRRQLRQDPSTPQEMRNELVDVQFPAHERQVDQPYKPRVFAAQEVLVEPNYVCYRKLLFEDKNTERYGWTLGPLQPLASFGQFYTDFTWAPYRWASYPCLRHECSAGLCLPGDPVPMMKYPPGLSLSGGLMQGVAVTALYVLVP